MEKNNQYPLAPQVYPGQFPQQNPQYPVQYVQEQYVQQATTYQQPMGFGNVIAQPSQPFAGQVVQKEMYIDPTGRQDAGVLKKSGLQKLDEQTGIFIKQKLEVAELVLGCETQNRYNVYALNADGNKKGRQIFKAKENSGFCTRFCLSGDCRPFKINIMSTIRGEEDDEYEPFLYLDRPCKFTCLCFNRPELKVNLVEGGTNEYIGKIVDPFNWCHMEMDIYDKDNNHKYTILGNCCQLGVWCQCPCEPCQTIDFDVKTASGEVISTLQKRTPGCLQAWTTDMDNFAMVFPKNCTPTDKALLMSAVLLLDYRHFERNPQNNG